MDPAAFAVTSREACVAGPLGWGCGFASELDCEPLPLWPPHRVKSDEDTRAIAPCSIWRRVIPDDSILFRGGVSLRFSMSYYKCHDWGQWPSWVAARHVFLV